MAKGTTAVFTLEGKRAGRIRLPRVFETTLRPDVIKRGVLSIQSHRYQPQGRDPLAGKRTTAKSIGVGHGLARVPRIGQSRRAALAPGTVGGRAAHPPVAGKKIKKKLSKRERRLSLLSAIAATGSKEVVAARGHTIDDVPDFPLVVTDKIQGLKKTSEVKDAFISLGVWPDVFRVKESVKIRAGKGKMRGRRKKMGVGPLIVITKDDGIVKASQNLSGVEVANVYDLNPELLAPGTHPGRFTLWTRSSIKALKDWNGER